MTNNYSDEEIVHVLRQFPEFTYEAAILHLDEMFQEHYDPEDERELCDMLEEREMESHAHSIRSQGGDYWRNDAGEWCCG
jgi:hypothetical protein